MPSKAEFYRQMAEQVSTRLVGSWKEWTAFLTTAARLYKYPFHEQMMIYAQRPDATACAEYDLWNEKMGRYVRRGSKGIALVDDSGDRPRLRYVFDISDTGTREHSRTPWLWQLEEQHIGPVSAMLERNYGVAGDDLAQQLTDVAGKLASEYWDEHQQDFRYIVDGSFLAEYDDYNIEAACRSHGPVPAWPRRGKRIGSDGGPDCCLSGWPAPAVFQILCPLFHRSSQRRTPAFCPRFCPGSRCSPAPFSALT